MKREGSQASESGAIARTEIALVVTLLVGVGFLAWSWLEFGTPTEVSCSSPTTALSTDLDGRRVGLFDESELVRALRARGLPAPDPPFAPMESVALEEFRRALEQLCQEPSAASYGRVGQFFHFYGRYAIARAGYREASRRDPGDFRWAHYLGCVALQIDDVKAAEAEFRRAIELEPNVPASRMHLARLLKLQDRLDEAMALMRECVDLDSGNPYVLTELAQIELLSGQPRAALDRLKEVLERHPTSPRAHQQLARVYLELGDPVRAQAHAARVVGGESALTEPVPDPLLRELSAVTGSVSHLKLLAGEHLAASRYSDMVKTLEELIERSPTVEFQSLLVKMYLKTERVDDARRTLDSLAQAKPDHPHSYSLRSVLAFMEHRYEDSLSWGKEALLRDPGFHSAHRQLAQTHWAMGRAEQGIPHARRAVELDPSDVSSQYLLGELCFMERRFPEARAAFESALALNPLLVAAHKRLKSMHGL